VAEVTREQRKERWKNYTVKRNESYNVKEGVDLEREGDLRTNLDVLAKSKKRIISCLSATYRTVYIYLSCLRHTGRFTSTCRVCDIPDGLHLPVVSATYRTVYIYLSCLRHTGRFTSTCRVCRTGCVQPEGFDVHESGHRDGIMKVTNKMQLYRLIYYS
jgi:hypothetical protein